MVKQQKAKLKAKKERSPSSSKEVKRASRSSSKAHMQESIEEDSPYEEEEEIEQRKESKKQTQSKTKKTSIESDVVKSNFSVKKEKPSKSNQSNSKVAVNSKSMTKTKSKAQKKERSRSRSNSQNKEEEQSKVMLKKGKNAKKQVDTGVQQFFENMAEEGSDEEGNGNNSDMNGSDVGERTQQRQEELRQLEQEMRNEHKYKPGFLEVDEDKVDEYFQDKYKEDANVLEDMDGEGLFGDELEGRDGDGNMFHIGELPHMGDPKVFAVSCWPQHEKEAVFTLLNKYVFFKDAKQKQPLVQSASFIEKFPGFVYIEAYKEVHVREAIKDIKGLRQNKIDIIPVKEVPLVYTADQAKHKEIAEGQWVRVKSGLYQGDVGRIVDFDESKTKIQVKLIPRLYEQSQQSQSNDDYQNNTTMMSQKQLRNIQKQRPAQKFFVKSEHAQEVETRRTANNDHFQVYQGMHFQNGFLFKQFGIKNLHYKDQIPCLSELDDFLKGEPNEQERQKVVDSTTRQMRLLLNTQNKFEKGDVVRVRHGDLSNLIGTVINSVGQEVTVLPQMEEITEPMSFKPVDLVKHFKEGDHVKICQGQYKAQTGRILKIEEEIASVMIDNQNSEVRVRLNDLKRSNEVLTDIKCQKNAMLNKFDLVKLSNFNSGCVILKLEKDSLTVLDNCNHMHTFNYFAVDQKINDFGVAFKNKFNQFVTVDCMVKVTEGENKNKSGVVKHIFQDQVFLYSTEFMSTMGIFAEPANNCYVVTSNLNSKVKQFSFNSNTNTNANTNTNTQQFGDITNKTLNNKNNSAPGTTTKTEKDRNRDPLVGQQVVISKGIWKGYQGRAKDADDTTVRVELNSKCKTITLSREFVQLPGGQEQQQVLDRYNKAIQGSKTPNHYGAGFASPGYGMAQSPGYAGMASPGWGNAFSQNSPSYN